MTSRKRTIEVSVINVAMQSPHSPEKYKELFKEAAKLDLAIPLRSNHAAQISCNIEEKSEQLSEFITGTIDKYFDLKKDEPWFNRRKAKKAEEEELQAVQQLPDELKPDYQSFTFAFHIEKHLFFLICRESGERSFSVTQVAMFLEKLLNHQNLQNLFGKTAITVIPRKGALDWILELEKLTRFEMIFFAPNADDGDPQEKLILEKLDKLHAQKMTTTFIAVEHDSLILDNETKNQALVASRNGVVEGHGKTIEGKTETRSTIDKPLIEKNKYVPNLKTRVSALIEKAKEIIKQG